MKRILSVIESVIEGSLILGLSSFAFAGHEYGKEQQAWQWKHIESLFPHTPGSKWVYALSGKQHTHGGELQVEVKGLQFSAQLKKDVLLIDERHPSATSDTEPEIVQYCTTHAKDTSCVIQRTSIRTHNAQA